MNPPKYNIGDVVIYTGKPGFWHKRPTIVCQVTYDTGQIEYATTQGAWFTEDDIQLVCKADKKSMKELYKSLIDDDLY